MTTEAAEARERVRKAWPGAWAEHMVSGPWVILTPEVLMLGDGPTEDEAWINAAAGLQQESEA